MFGLTERKLFVEEVFTRLAVINERMKYLKRNFKKYIKCGYLVFVLRLICEYMCHFPVIIYPEMVTKNLYGIIGR